MSEGSDPSSSEVPNLDQTHTQDERFPVVGIGASAGGLEAFRQVLRHLPTDTGMAFVLIQHLDPDQKSILTEILTRETAMSVQDVQDEMTVEPNHVYVIPSNTTITIVQGRLHLIPRDRTRRLVMPIDTFFLSLAEDQGEKAIAIVLSGGDGDGSRGLEAVKGAGGITFAQSKESAQVSSMPNTAVATGQVNFILPPREIAEKLASISRHPYIVAPTSVEAIGEIPTSESALDVSPERLQRFFVPLEGGYQINKSVRELCVFAKQNLCSDPPFSRLDLISCRNVLIYLEAVLQKKILPTFHYGLKPTGFLMLGTSETTGETSELFTVVDKKYKIYARKPFPARLPLDLIANTYASEIPDPASRTYNTARSEIDWQQTADRIVIERYAPVGVVINQELEIVHFRGQTSLYLEPPAGRASLNLLRMAKEGLTLELRTAIHQAKQQNAPVRKDGVQFQDRDQVRSVNLEVVPLKAPTIEECHFLVLFEDASSLLISPRRRSDQTRLPTRDKSFLALLWLLLRSSLRKLVEQPSSLPASSSNLPEVAQLQQELATTQEYLRSIIEEQEATNQDLRVANEEILSSNEELQSSNEELETATDRTDAKLDSSTISSQYGGICHSR